MKLYWLLSLIAFATCGLSAVTFLFTDSFAQKANKTYLEGAPKATSELHSLYIPPMVKMQLLVLCYDSLAALYYLYQLPIWDAWKNTM